MFTGLVEARAPLLALQPRGAGAHLRIARPPSFERLDTGESLLVSGACLTLAAQDRDSLAFDLSHETLARTWFRDARPGRLFNLERALRLSDRLGGHLVTGHVDGLARVTRLSGDRASGWTFGFEVPEGLERHLVDKGCVAIDGVSLTVVRPEGREFEVAVIPVTYEGTSLGGVGVGEVVHVETDLLAKYVSRMLDQTAEREMRGGMKPGRG